MPATETWTWTDQRVATLRDLKARGFTSSEIMREIGAPSRNTVIGKVVRLGLVPGKRSVPLPKSGPKPKARVVLAPVPVVKPAANLHAGNIARKAATLAKEREAAAKVPVPAEPLPEVARPAVPGVAFFARDMVKQCAWPLPGWDAAPIAEKRFCGEPTVSGTSWCAHCLPRATTAAGYRQATGAKRGLGFRP